MAGDMPVGFSMALAQDEAAITRFARLTPDARERVLRRARQASSAEEMRALVRQLSGAE